ncbi:MAG: chemotaxis protein CheD [Caulobacteraceae bacterium]|nr:chemotaxis protein CheD [Caulobacteraceae bacterium]
MNFGPRKLHVIQGEHAVSTDQDAILTTVLGSCVAACMHDPQAGVGGMNHFLLPEDTGGSAVGDESMRYGAYAMEMLINDLMKLGARRERLQAKLFGGARLFDTLGDIGAANAAFARRFLELEGIAVTGGSLGGLSARRIEFWPASGRARQRAVEQAPDVMRPPVRPTAPSAGGVELF